MISLFHLLLIGAIVLFVLGPIASALVKGASFTRPGALLMTGGILALLFFGFFGMPRLQRVFPQGNSAVQYTREASPPLDAWSTPMPTDVERFSPVGVKMLILGLLLAVPIILALRFAHQRHWCMHIGRHIILMWPLLLIPLGLLFLGFFAVERHEVSSEQIHLMPAYNVRTAETAAVHKKAIRTEPDPTTADNATIAEAEAKISSEKQNTAESEDPAVATIDKPAATENLPDWVHDSRQLKDDVYYEVVPLKGIVDPNIRYEMMNAKLKEVANHYIDEIVFHQPGASTFVNLSPDYLREKCNGGEFESRSGSGDAYFRLKFDKDFRTLVERQYRTFVAQDHLQQLGTAGLVAFAALGGLYVLLRAAPKNAGGKAATDTAVPHSTA